MKKECKYAAILLMAMLMFSSAFGMHAKNINTQGFEKKDFRIQLKQASSTTVDWTIEVRVHRVTQIDEIDPGSGADWYWYIIFNNSFDWDGNNVVQKNCDDLILDPPMSYYFYDDIKNVSIEIQLWEEDLSVDDLADISSHSGGGADGVGNKGQDNHNKAVRGAVLKGIVNRETGSWSGDYLYTDDNGWLVTDGESDDEPGDQNDARIHFEIYYTPWNPNKPSKPIIDGPNEVHIGKQATFTATSDDADGDQIKYFWDFNDDWVFDIESGWLASGTPHQASWTWNELYPNGIDIHVQVIDSKGGLSPVANKTILVTNYAPSASKPNGQTSGKTGVSYTYISIVTDPDQDMIYCLFDWGDGTNTGWIGPYASGTSVQQSHTWDNKGSYYVKVRAKDQYELLGDWSDSLLVTITNPQPPNKPSKPSGPQTGRTGETYSYSTSTTDPNGDQILYEFDWGDGTTDQAGWYDSGSSITISHSWKSKGDYNVRVRAKDTDNMWSDWSDPLTVHIGENHPPNTPNTPNGTTQGRVGVMYDYVTSTTDIDGDNLYYWFDWGDGTNSGWIGPYESGASCQASHIWNSANTYQVKVKAKDTENAESNWSTVLTVKIEENSPPNTPALEGPTSGEIDELLQYTAYATDDDGDKIKYYFDWGDGTGEWTGLVDSGETISKSHRWDSPGTYIVRVKAQDEYGAESDWSNEIVVEIMQGNRPPEKPTRPSGPASGKAGKTYTYSAFTTDPDEDEIFYLFDWGDGTNSGWLGPYNSGETVEASHSWSEKGEYSIKVKAKDVNGLESEWSDPLVISMPLSIKISSAQKSIMRITISSKNVHNLGLVKMKICKANQRDAIPTIGYMII